MGRKKKVQKSANKATVERKQSLEKSVEDCTNEDEDDINSHNTIEDITAHSPKNERSSTPIIHKKFGKVICPDENESSNSHTTDSQTEDNLEPDSKSCDTQDELTYGNQIVCEEIEVLTSEDIQMSEDGTSGSFHMSNNGTQQQVFEIDEKFKQVSMSNPPHDSNTSHLISTSNSNSVDGAPSYGISPLNSFEGSTVQCSTAAEKLLSHQRSRSGSTDTTSSESGSTSSSSVRRSSRIKHTVQHRHREVVDSSLPTASASLSTTKPTSTLILAPPSPSSGNTSDADKPVKVKSRWRRTSELEMVVAPRPHPLVGDSSQPQSPQTPLPHPSPLSPCDTSSSSSTLGKPCPAVEEKLKTFERIDFNIYKTVSCSRCNLKDRCSNKRFQNLEYARCEMFKTEMKGFGLRALEDIPADTFLFEYVGEVVDTREFHRRALGYSQDNNRHYYFMSLRPDAIIDATMKGNISRFINHSCDPNSETQKWTVDGELRIGFFSRKNIKQGEELTFDYQYQRYGKEAQKCYCGSKNCRGWIGENPDDDEEEEEFEEEEEEEEGEDAQEGGERIMVESKPPLEGTEEEEAKKKVEKTEKERRKEKKTRVRKKQRDADYVVDDPEKDLSTLARRGIHNKMDTLAVLRCLVLAETAATRYEVLRLVRSAAAPCRRLLIDYHILKLLYTWMTLSEPMSLSETIKHRMEILETLSKLPIPDKTKLKDSQVLQLVTDWSRTQDSESEDLKVVRQEAAKLLDQWSNLVDTFRIPKKERIEQMKEHERQADRGYRDRDSTYDKTWDRYRGDIRKDDKYKIDHRKDRKSSRESPPDHRRGPKLSKYEHRQLFALKVQAEDEERRKQEAEWNMHVERCKMLGLDPTNVSTFDEITGYPVFINPPPLGTMIPWYPPTPDMSVGGTPVGPGGSAPPIGFGPDGTPIFAPPSSLFPPPMGLPLPPPNQMYPGYPAHPMLPPHEEPPPPPPPPLPPPIRLPKFWKTAADAEGRIYYYHCKTRHTQWEPPPYQPPPPLPPPPEDSSSSSSGCDSSESSEEEEEEEEDEYEEFDDDKLIRDLNKKTKRARGSSSKFRGVSSVTTNGTSLVDSMDAGEEEEDQTQAVKHETEDPVAPPPNVEDIGDHAPSSTVQTPPTRKRKREGLVTEYIISPIQEIEKQKARERKRKVKDTKEKLKAVKKRKYLEAQAAARELKKKKAGSMSSSTGRSIPASGGTLSTKLKVKTEISSATSTSKIESAPADSSEPGAARHMKEQFRLGMAGVIVHYLNPYRKEDCTRGRIMNNDDFKHLARKLTHFVLVKELKHCRSVGDLQCNENVKHKAKDFIRKYMSKFGEVYVREKEIE
ncbi:hypothetical protein M8J75_009263 [Diaphorina citri]|nr:hypothetical protein M8J75_009263 [Diaphorina citri]